jgi:outer membrane protein TolC
MIGIVPCADANTITQKEFLDRLKHTHPLFKKEKLTVQIEQQKRNGYLGRQDWNIQSAFFLLHDEPSYAIAGPEKTDAVSVSSGLEKAIWSTGGRLSASFSSSYANLTIDPFLGIPDSYYENTFTITYNHPLMRNKRGSLDRLQYELSQYDVNFSEVVIVENEESFLAQSAAKFLDWVLLEEQQRIVVERLRLSEEELNRTRRKRASNLIDEIDVIRAEDAVRIARQNFILIKSKSKALRFELAVLLQDSTFVDIAPEHNLYEASIPPSLSEVTAQLKYNSRLLKALTIRINQQDLVRTGFEEQSRADLSLIAQVGIKNAETSYGSSLVMDKPDARIGLQLAFPVGNRTAKANVARTTLVTMQLQKQFEELTIALSSAAANLLTQLSELETVLQLNREQIESAERKTAEELKLYDRGRGELTFVIQSRDSEQAARLTYAMNAHMHQKLILQLQELMDQLHN